MVIGNESYGNQEKIGANNSTDLEQRFDVIESCICPHAHADAWGLAKIILPADVCKALVTTTRSSPPT